MEKTPSFNTVPTALFNGAIPIIVNHTPMANLFAGKFLFEPPNADAMAAFRQQAAKWHFNEASFIEAVLNIPIISKDRVKAILQYLKQLAEMIGEMGLSRLKQEESEQRIAKTQTSLEKEVKQRKEEAEKLSRILEANPIPTFVIDATSTITHFNRACEKLTGIPATDMIGTANHQKAYSNHRRPLLADPYHQQKQFE